MIVDTVRLLSAALLATAVCTCNGTVETQEPPERAIVIQSLTLAGTTDEAATVTVDQQEDTDETNDTNWSASFLLEERKSAVSLPVDDGTARTHTFDVKSITTGSGAVSRTRVRISVDSD